MRIRLVDVEGTPEELAQLPELREALLGVADLGPGMAEPDDDEEGVPIPDFDAGELSKELRDFIAVRAGNRGRADTVQAWVGEVLGWGTTTSELERSRTSSDGLNNYLMPSEGASPLRSVRLRHTGQRQGDAPAARQGRRGLPARDHPQGEEGHRLRGDRASGQR